MADGDNALPQQLDMTKSIPVGSGKVAPQAGGDALPASLDMSKSQPLPGRMKTEGPQDFGSVTGNIAIGALKGTLQDVDAAGHALKAMGSAVPMPGNMDKEAGAIIPASGLRAEDAAATPHGGAQQIGTGLEEAGEWAAGDEALSALAKMPKIPPQILEMAEKYPTMTKILTSQAAKKAERVALSTAEGGAQGAVHGTAEGKSAQEAEGGALGGGLGESVVQIGSELASLAGKRVGIGTTAEQDAMRGYKPSKRNNQFLDKFQTSAPVLQADPAFREATTVRDQVDAIDDVRKNWWVQKVQPVIDSVMPNGTKVADVPLSGLEISNAIRSRIPSAMTEQSPEEAAKMDAIAKKFIPDPHGFTKPLPIGKAEETLEHYNALVARTGYWSKPASERAAMMKTDGELAGNMAAADAIRDELYKRLGIVVPGTDMAELKKTYGALRSVQDELQGRINVEGRQAPTSLKELVGLTAGIATGGVHGALAAAVPFIDREANTTARLVKRATAKQAGAEPGMATKLVTGAGKLADKTIPPATAAAGEVAGEDQPSGHHALIRTSDGAFHTVPVEHLDTVRQRDPNVTVISEK
jgi:hypothetical protein